MINVKAGTTRRRRASQGDVYKDIECVEYAVEKRGVIEVSKIVFKLVVVLTQDCDLEQDFRYRVRQSDQPRNQDKRLFNILVAPLYNAEHVFQGTHLQELKMKMAEINKRKTPGQSLMQNERPRYHYLEFPQSVPIVPMVIDFKHYFSVNLAYIQTIKPRNFVCRLSELYREDLSQRFAAYLSRIALPEVVDRKSGRTPYGPEEDSVRQTSPPKPTAEVVDMGIE